jgi:hypothetical protein
MCVVDKGSEHEDSVELYREAKIRSFDKKKKTAPVPSKIAYGLGVEPEPIQCAAKDASLQ